MGVSPALLVGREQRSDVAEPGSPEHGVDHGVGEDVGVGMAVQADLMWDLDATEHEPASRGEPVGVVADPDAQGPEAHPSGSSRRFRRSKTAICSIPQSPISETACS